MGRREQRLAFAVQSVGKPWRTATGDRRWPAVAVGDNRSAYQSHGYLPGHGIRSHIVPSQVIYGEQAWKYL